MGLNNLLYLGNRKSNPICRDAMKLYAESLDFEYKDLTEELISQNLFDKTLIVDCGWKDEEYTNLIIKLNNKYKDNLYLRLVDDCVLSYTEFDLKFIKEVISNNRKIISPYEHEYFTFFKPLKVIPYHYNELDECEIDTRTGICALSGFNNEIYKLRSEIYDKFNNELITKLDHPGYSGRFWKDKIGKSYIKELSKYKFMIVTTAQDFELLKYIECAEAGCCPIGEFPNSLLRTLPIELHKYNCKSYEELERSLINNYDDWKQDAQLYRDYIKSIRNKTLIKSYYELI